MERQEVMPTASRRRVGQKLAVTLEEQVRLHPWAFPNDDCVVSPGKGCLAQPVLFAVFVFSRLKTRARPGVHTQCLDNRLRPCGTVGAGALVFAQAGRCMVVLVHGAGTPGHPEISHGLPILVIPERRFCPDPLESSSRSLAR